ncbi:MAG: hypothetical protein QOG75_4939 [Mycobacterium sp.]|jgi:uncharacterized protein YukE|nr:hypothetical protein [Mycobacterium sp.]
MSATGAGWAEREYQDVLDKISSGLDELQRKSQSLEQKLDRTLRFIMLPPVADAIIAGFHQFIEIRDTFIDEAQEFLTQPGWAPALFRIGDMWESKVGTPLSEQAAMMGAGRRAADNSWTGSAARAYHDAADEQQGAAQSMKPLAEKVQDLLSDLGFGLIGFAVGVAFAVTTFVLEMAAAIIAAASVVGAPASPEIAIGAAVTGIGLLAAAIAAFLEYLERIKGAERAITQNLDDTTGMPDNHWPDISKKITNGGSTWRVATD